MDHGMFTQTEIELLLKSARSAQPGADASAPAPHVEPFDFQGANHLSSGQIAQLLELHNGFANQLGRSLSALLASECKASAVSVEQIAYGELLKQFPESELFETLHVSAPEGSVFLLADLASVVPLIDLMLGGDGTAAAVIRPLTEVDRDIFKPVVETLGADLQSAWASFWGASPCFKHCAAPADLLPAAESVLFVKFEIQIGELHGTWTLILPMLISNALTRKLEQQLSRTEFDRSEQNQLRLKERLLDSQFRLELFLPPSGIPVRELAHLKAGQVLVLKPRATEPIHFNLVGIKLFQASPVSCGARRGAQIKRTLSVVKKDEKEAR